MKALNKLAFATITTFTIAGCGGGGGGGVVFQTTFNAVVSGLDPGESITVVSSLYADKTLTQTSVVSQNGLWSSTINLPEGKSIAFDAKIEVEEQLVTKSCTVTYANLDVSSSNNTIRCGPISAAGLYSGRVGLDSGTGVATLVILNDASYWMFAGSEISGGAFYNTLIRGDAGVTTPSTYTANRGINVGNNERIQISGTYNPNISFEGFLTEMGLTFPLSLKSLPVRSYQFTERPDLSKIAGSYTSGTDNFTISSPLGTLTGSTSDGCRFSGVVSPKITGENIYDLTLTYTAAPCPVDRRNSTLRGIIVSLATASQKPGSGNYFLGGVLGPPVNLQLLGALTNPTNTTGAVFAVTKTN